MYKIHYICKVRSGIDINNQNTRQPHLAQDNCGTHLGQTLNHMKRYLIIGLFGLVTWPLAAQICDLHTSETPIDSVIQIDEVPITRYLLKELRYPFATQVNNLVGIYIGAIRVAPTGELISISTIHPIDKSTALNFNETITKAWRKHTVHVSGLRDTTDFLISVKLMLSKGFTDDPLPYHVDTDMAPANLCETAILVGFNSDGTAEIIDDQELLEQSNTNFKAKKYTRCIKSLSELIRRNPYNPSLYVMRAKSYELLGETENACADYDYLRCFLNYTLHKQPPCH